MSTRKKRGPNMSNPEKNFDVTSGLQIADGYSKAAFLLMKYSSKNEDSEVIHSLMVLKGLALEVYLKCLHALDHQKSYEGHDVKRLFDSLSEQTQTRIAKYYEELVGKSRFIDQTHAHHKAMKGHEAKMDLEHVLGEWSHAFGKWKFFYEPEHKVSFLAFGELRKALRQQIQELKPELVAA
jgi:hypothetical protein